MRLDSEKWGAYSEALDRAETTAIAADALTGELMDAARIGWNMNVPGDDRAAKLELAIYEFLKEAN